MTVELTKEQQIDAHLGKPIEIEIEDNGIKTKLELKGLGIEHFPKVIRSQDIMGKIYSKEQSFANLTDEQLKDITGLIMATLKESMPDSDEKKLEKLAMNHFLELWTSIAMLNSLGMEKVSPSVMKKLEKVSDGLKKEDTGKEPPKDKPK